MNVLILTGIIHIFKLAIQLNSAFYSNWIHSSNAVDLVLYACYGYIIYNIKHIIKIKFLDTLFTLAIYSAIIAMLASAIAKIYFFPNYSISTVQIGLCQLYISLMIVGIAGKLGFINN